MLKHEVGGLGGEGGECGEFGELGGGPRPGCPCPGWGGSQWRKRREMGQEMGMERRKKKKGNRNWKQNGRRGAAA